MLVFKPALNVVYCSCCSTVVNVQRAQTYQKGKLADREVLGDVALAIPNSRASTWPRSWKRFMIDYMYGRGEVSAAVHSFAGVQ